MIELDKLNEYDELKVSILVKKGTKVNFERGNLLLLSKSPISDEEYAVSSANYNGNGIWLLDKKVIVKSFKVKI